MYAEVVIDRSAHALSAPLTYDVPPALNGNVAVGSYVLVPLQRKEATGFVVELVDSTEFAKTKPILSVLSATPLFNESALQLARWISSYYHAPLADALACIAPPRATAKLSRTLVWQGPSLSETLIAHDLTPAREIVVCALHECGGSVSPERLRLRVSRSAGGADGFDAALRWLKKQNWVREEFDLRPPSGKPKLVRTVELARAVEGDALSLVRSKGQRALLAELAKLKPVVSLSNPPPVPISELLRRSGASRATLTALIKAGWVRLREVEARRFAHSPDGDDAPAHTLNAEQQAAVAQIESALGAGKQQTFLLHGVTASGKTEVYLRAIESTLSRGRNVIVLVPEIALTAQAQDIFLTRFPDQVAVLHSALSPGERYDEWRRLERGEARIALGARSAVFAPLPNLGLFIIDEEHEGSYKQENSPRYHARDVALARARAEGATVILGSATPSLESVFHAKRGSSRIIEMKDRVLARPMPTVEIVDLRREPRLPGYQEAAQEPPTLSQRLRAALLENSQRGEQVMLFLNRRGFSSVIFCPDCGVYERCPHCAVALTYHQHVNRLRCHHCNFIRMPKEECPKCKGRMIGYGGPGTERVEREVRELLPDIEIVRMDRDTTTRKGAHAKLLRVFRTRKASVLIGTQMIAKGLDFPGVTLVGVINADVGLHAPDWRAAERTFQLLVQVSGRAGRGENPGHVIVQTYLPTHYAILQATHGSFAVFAEAELRFRQQAHYPPFTFCANVVVSAKSNKSAQQRIGRIAAALNDVARKLGAQDVCLGPAPCPLAKLRGEFRWHLFLRDGSRPRLHQILAEGVTGLKAADLKGMTIDVDPMNVM